MTLRLHRMAWLYAGMAWCAAAAAGAVIVGRALRHADQRERFVPQLDDPLRRGTDLTPPVAAGLPGAILALGYATDEDAARYWLAVCARRGADPRMLEQLRTAWERDHRGHVTYLYTDNITDEDPDL